MWIISISLLDPLTYRQSSMFGTFSASVYDREFHDQERSKLWAQSCRRSGGGFPSYRLPDSSGVSSSMCGLHRCNRWTYAILTDLWGFIGDPSDLPYKFSHSHLVLQTPTDGFLSVNEMIKSNISISDFRYVLASFYFTAHTNIPNINFRFQICLSFLLFHRTYKYP